MFESDNNHIKELLEEFLQQYYNDSFSRMACDYIHATGITQEEVEELLEAMKKINSVPPNNSQFQAVSKSGTKSST